MVTSCLIHEDQSCRLLASRALSASHLRESSPSDDGHRDREPSAPAEFRSDVLEDAFEHVGVVIHTQLVRDREEQRIGRPDRLVAREFLDQHIGFRDVRAAEDGPRVGIDVADLVFVAALATEIRPVAVVDEREDAAADGHAWLTPMPGLLPRLTIGFDLLALLYV